MISVALPLLLHIFCRLPGVHSWKYMCWTQCGLRLLFNLLPHIELNENEEWKKSTHTEHTTHNNEVKHGVSDWVLVRCYAHSRKKGTYKVHGYVIEIYLYSYCISLHCYVCVCAVQALMRSFFANCRVCFFVLVWISLLHTLHFISFVHRWFPKIFDPIKMGKRA